MIDLLNSYKYYINQSNTNYKEDYVFKKNILELIDQIILELAKKDNIVKIAYMQDQFYKTKKDFSRYFYSLEPITLEYINSSVKKEFVYNDYFISKIFINNSSYKYFDFVNSAFKGKTTIKFTNQVFLISFILLLLLLLLNNFKLIFSIIKK